MVNLPENSLSLNDSISFLQNEWGVIKPEIGIICGSGWGALNEIFQNSSSIDYKNLPGMSSTTVEGHEGKLSLCEINQRQILLFQGRRHFYEGDGWDPITFPILLSHAMGIKTMILTNAAGGINPSFKVGDLMLMEDHINLMGSNPLIGPNLNPSIPRFPDQSEIYNIGLRNRILEMSETVELPIRKGIYLALSGPSFETPAEIKAFQVLGADAVGMSTVPEAMVCNALGMKVIGLSCITNLAAGIASHKLTHEDVQNTSDIALPKMKKLIMVILKTLLV